MDQDLHKSFKAVASSHGLTLRAALVEAVGLWLRERTK